MSLQAGVGAAQRVRLLFEHCTQVPASGPVARHAGLSSAVHAFVAPLPKSPLHGTHEPPEQIGVAPEHCAFDTHCTHVLVVVSHWGFDPLQSLKSRHCTHTWVSVLQRGVGAEQLTSEEHPAPQVLVVRLHTPLAPVHCALDVHCTHSWVASLQTGSPGVHAVRFVPGGGPAPSLHSTQKPPAHAGVSAFGHARTAGGAPAVPLSALQPAHVFVAVLQIGFGPLATQLPLVTHSTHVFVALLQTGVAPVQSFVFPELHWTHAPVAMLHAGAPAVGHGLVLAPPLSPSHFTQAPPLEHTGFVAVVHCVKSRHSTHVFVVVSQKGVAPPQVVLSVQATQRPFLQRGVAPPHCVSSTQLDAHT